MPASGAILDSTIISMRPADNPQTITTTTRASLGTVPIPLDDREIFKVLHDCMKYVGKFRQYIYYLGTSCDTTKLRNKIQKLKERINRSFDHQQELIRNGALGIGSIKSESVIRRFEKFLCFTLASINYYEDLLHKLSILFVYFPLATDDRNNVVSLGFEDSTINADEVSFENHEVEDNETNRYIELLNQIQFLQTLREEIEQIDVYQLRHHATSYSKDFVDNMHKYTTEAISDNSIQRSNGRHRFTLRYYLNDESTTSIMIEGHLYIFPLSVCVLIPFAYFISFIIAVYLGHSKFEFPFLSRSSTDSPESCINSQIINFASFVLVITIYIRYRQIAELIRNNPTCGRKYSRSNLTFLICGTTAAFAMSIISNFPHTNVFFVRIFATYITFIASVGALYCEMFLSIWIRPLLYSSRILPILRTILTIICTLVLLAFIIFQTITIIKYDNEKKIWTPTSPGWNYHLSTIFSTWILTSSLLIYILTLIIDFHRIKIISPKIYLSNDIIDEQMNNTLSLSI